MGSTFRKGSAQSAASERLSQELAETARTSRGLATSNAALTQPLRTGTANILGNFLQTGTTPSFLDLPQSVVPTANLQLPGLEQGQLDLRKSLLAQGSRGGLLQQQLAQGAIQGGLARNNLQVQDILRQEQRDVLRQNIAGTLFGGAADMGTGGLAQAFTGLSGSMAGTGNAASNLNTLGSQRMTQNQIAQQGIGQLLGKAAGGAAAYGLGAPAAGTLGAAKLGSRA